MPKLGRDEIRKHPAWLREWRTPLEMLEYSECLRDHMASDTKGISAAPFNRRGADFVTEAISAAKFANIRNADRVRLVAEDRPDFQICTSEGIENWELTEALEPGRRRGDEYERSARLAVADKDHS